jgi:hypothetical protein
MWKISKERGLLVFFCKLIFFIIVCSDCEGELLATSTKLELVGPSVGSSTSADPSSSSAANTNSSAAPSSDGSMLRQNWPSQSHDLHSQVCKRSTTLHGKIFVKM